MFDRSLNQVTLIGNIGNNIDSRLTNSNKPVINFNLATTRSWKKAETGERIEDTQWHRITVFGGLGQLCTDYLAKGTKILVVGRLENNRYEDKAGIERFTTSIIANEIQLLSKVNKEALATQPSNQLSNQSTPTSWGDRPEPAIIDFEESAPE